MSQRHYDYVIVGSGLPGLLLASALSRFTSNIALLEANDTFGGCHKKIENENRIRIYTRCCRILAVENCGRKLY